MLVHQASRLNTTTQEVETLNGQALDLLTQVSELRCKATISQGTASPSRHGHPLEPESHTNNPPVYDGDPNA
ncbi:MAG: hypothetical protein ACRC9V_13915, partial [Aeromonas sp.]